MTEEQEKTNVKGEFPQMYALAVEHLGNCKACAQRAASHHVGVGEVHEDTQMKSMMDTTEAGVSQIATSMGSIQLLIEESKNLIKEAKDVIVSVNRIHNTLESAYDEVIKAKFGDIPLMYKVGAVVATVASFVFGAILPGVL